jgi:hypothetical protein
VSGEVDGELKERRKEGRKGSGGEETDMDAKWAFPSAMHRSNDREEGTMMVGLRI